MKILLADLDHPGEHHNHFGNLALMKISAWRKSLGDEVFLNSPLEACDACYVSCVFIRNMKHIARYPKALMIGGSGASLLSRLPDHVEHLMPDYSLYGLEHSMGFTSRGCIRNCPWCIVREKEGDIRANAEIYEFWNRRHQRIMLLDNNLLASPNWRETLHAINREDLVVDFNQGLDIRMLDDEKAHLLSRVKLDGYLRFSFDNPRMESAVRTGVALMEKAGVPPNRLLFYVLVGWKTTFEEDKERFAILKSLRCQAFPMQYNNKPPARGFIQEEELPRGPRDAVRKYIRSARGTLR